ncbi:MAG: ParB/RepB/Spo0J family partition protein [Caldilineaceae bacterium]|nr:ParB/RepB/Spo0J family partition protein [Caldilineaceae bacterium]
MASNANKRRGLGRGLGALIVDTQSSTPPPAATDQDGEGIRTCAVKQISPNPHQPRDHFDEAALNELAASIQTHGIIQPLIVTEIPEQPGHYWLIAGERRWRAAQRAQLTTVPVIVREASSQQLVEWALVENIQRADLNPLEEGTAYKTLVEEFKLTHAQVADRVGKSRSAITNTMRLLSAPPSVQTAVTNKTISAGHARSLLALEEPATIEAALQEVLSLDLNVRQTEALVKAWQEDQASKKKDEADPVEGNNETSREEDGELSAPQQAQVRYLEDRFRSALGTRVNLNRQKNGSGRLVIHFFNDDDLDNIYRLITGEQSDEEL